MNHRQNVAKSLLVIVAVILAMACAKPASGQTEVQKSAKRVGDQVDTLKDRVSICSESVHLLSKSSKVQAKTVELVVSLKDRIDRAETRLAAFDEHRPPYGHPFPRRSDPEAWPATAQPNSIIVYRDGELRYPTQEQYDDWKWSQHPNGQCPVCGKQHEAWRKRAGRCTPRDCQKVSGEMLLCYPEDPPCEPDSIVVRCSRCNAAFWMDAEPDAPAEKKEQQRP